MNIRVMICVCMMQCGVMRAQEGFGVRAGSYLRLDDLNKSGVRHVRSASDVSSLGNAARGVRRRSPAETQPPVLSVAVEMPSIESADERVLESSESLLQSIVDIEETTSGPVITPEMQRLLSMAESSGESSKRKYPIAKWAKRIVLGAAAVTAGYYAVVLGQDVYGSLMGGMRDLKDGCGQMKVACNTMEQALAHLTQQVETACVSVQTHCIPGLVSPLCDGFQALCGARNSTR